MRCRSARHPYGFPCGKCPICIKKARIKAGAILERSFSQQAPNHLLTLSVENLYGSEAWQKVLKKFTQLMRDSRKKGLACEYLLVLEFGERYRGHVHLALLTKEPSSRVVKALVREWWLKACGGRHVRVWAERVNDPLDVAHYITKHQGGDRLPVGWNRRKCRLMWFSRNLLVKSKQALWLEQIQEWYGSREGPAGEAGPDGAEHDQGQEVERGAVAGRVQV